MVVTILESKNTTFPSVPEVLMANTVRDCWGEYRIKTLVWKTILSAVTLSTEKDKG